MGFPYNTYSPLGQYGVYGAPQGLFNAAGAPHTVPVGNPVPAAVPAAPGFVCRPVTSRAEADVYQIPFDGSTTYLVDTSSGNIYAKAFDSTTGTAPVVTYTREGAPRVRYATLDDLAALRNELKGETTHDE